MANGHGYTGPINYYSSGLPYIHQDKIHIGLAQGGGGASAQLSQEELISAMNYRQDKVFQETQRRYKQLFAASLSDESAELLQEVFIDDDMMGTLNKELAEKIQSIVPTPQLGELHSIQQEITTKLINNLMSNGAQSAEAFDKLLDAMARAVNLLDTPESGLLAVALSNAKFNETVSGRRAVSTMGKQLQGAVDSFMKDNNNKIIDGSALDGVVKQLNVIAADFSTGKFRSGKGKSLTVEGVRKLIDNLFSTQFGEGIAAAMNYSALSAVNENITSQLTGGNVVHSQMPSGKIAKNSAAAQGKADIKTENVTVHLDYNAGAAGGDINLTVGISAKNYKRMGFMPVPGQSGVGSISAGSAGSLDTILSDLYGGRLSRMRYLADNILAHGGDGLDGAQQALQAVMLKRQVVNLFAARGGSLDFAQFLLVNGRIISMWDIIQSVQNYSGLSASTSPNEPVVISIEGRPNIYAAGMIDDEASRVAGVAKAIRDAKVKAHLNLAYL